METLILFLWLFLGTLTPWLHSRYIWCSWIISITEFMPGVSVPLGHMDVEVWYQPLEQEDNAPDKSFGGAGLPLLLLAPQQLFPPVYCSLTQQTVVPDSSGYFCYFLVGASNAVFLGYRSRAGHYAGSCLQPWESIAALGQCCDLVMNLLWVILHLGAISHRPGVGGVENVSVLPLSLARLLVPEANMQTGATWCSADHSWALCQPLKNFY